jgi:uncharacterized alpha-E superfamily protein
MLSRVAESIYWLSRYIERAENVARFIDVNRNLTLGEVDSLSRQWTPLVYTTADQDAFAERYRDASRANVIRFLAFDEENENSIVSCVAKARENARTIREVISSVVWEQLNKFFFMVRDQPPTEDVLEQPQEFCERVRLASHLLVGAMSATMPYDEGWHFSQLGRMIERADKTSRIVDVQYYLLLPDKRQVGTAVDVVRWSALLRSAGALEPYRRLHGKIVPERVAEYLLLDRRFPRSMHFGVIRAHESLRDITGSETGTFQNRSERELGRLRATMDYAEIDEVLSNGLHEFIDEFQSQLNQIGAAVRQDFFLPPRSRSEQASVSSARAVQLH